MNITSDEAKIMFEEAFPHMSNYWHLAWIDALERNHIHFTPSCRAHMMQNIAIGSAMENFRDFFPDAQYVEQYGQQLIVIPDRLILGFKKVDYNLTPRSYQTRRVKRYYKQAQISGLEDVPRLICGAKVNSDWSDIDGVFLVFPKNSRSYNWALNIEDHISELDQSQVGLTFDDEPEFFKLEEEDAGEESQSS